MMIFAAGNYYNASKVTSSKRLDGSSLFFVHGFLWIKSKKKFSSNMLLHCVGETKPVTLTDEEAKQQGLV